MVQSAMSRTVLPRISRFNNAGNGVGRVGPRSCQPDLGMQVATVDEADERGEIGAVGAVGRLTSRPAPQPD